MAMSPSINGTASLECAVECAARSAAECNGTSAVKVAGCDCCSGPDCFACDGRCSCCTCCSCCISAPLKCSFCSTLWRQFDICCPVSGAPFISFVPDTPDNGEELG